MTRYYIYKLTFMNGCTYIGKHHQINKNDKYITSSSYYHNKGGKDILLKREILLDNLPDSDICDIMETLCILHDRAENINNVNYNKGAWISNQFDRGFSGKENGMYGKSVESVVGKEKWQEIWKKSLETRRKNFADKVANGYVPEYIRRKRRIEINKHFREINSLIRKAHKEYDSYIKSLPKRWYYNKETLKETYWYEQPGPEWILGRVPHSLWTDGKKKSYAEKHSFNPIERMSAEAVFERNRKLSENQKGKVCFTNGKRNVFLRQGQDIPEGFWKGCTFEKTELYIATRKKKGEKKKNG